MVDAGGMREPPSSNTYLFDRGQGDQERLIRSSEALSAVTTEGCLRAGLGPGGRAIDVGCGPLSALIALAELVGSEGRVAGLDSSGEVTSATATQLRSQADRRLALLALRPLTASVGQKQRSDLPNPSQCTGEHGKIEVKITNTSQSTEDERRRGPRYARSASA